MHHLCSEAWMPSLAVNRQQRDGIFTEKAVSECPSVETRVLHFLAVLASLRCAILTPITLLSTCSTRRALLQR